MVFREKEESNESCVSGIPPLNNSTVAPRLVENRPHQSRYSVVGRMVVDQNIYVGLVDYPNESDVATAYLSIEGEEVRKQTDYELLSVSPICSLALVPYTAGDTMTAAVLSSAMWLGRVPPTAFDFTDRIWILINLVCILQWTTLLIIPFLEHIHSQKLTS